MPRKIAITERRWARRVTRERIVAALGIIALGLLAFLYFRSPPKRTYHLTITAGSPQGLRHQMALTLAAEARKHGVSIRQMATAGSEEALDWVDARTTDLALVQGCLDLGSRNN